MADGRKKFGCRLKVIRTMIEALQTLVVTLYQGLERVQKFGEVRQKVRRLSHCGYT